MWIRNLSLALRQRSQDPARFYVALGTLLVVIAGVFSLYAMQSWSTLFVGLFLGAVEFLSLKDDGRVKPFRSVYDDDEEDDPMPPLEEQQMMSSKLYFLHKNPWQRNALLAVGAYWILAWTVSVSTVGAALLLFGTSSRLKDCVKQKRADRNDSYGTLSYGGQQVHLLCDWKA
eukprot:PhF_6_TR11182/c0_g1_i3/m.18020